MNALKASIATVLISFTSCTFASEGSGEFQVWADVTEVRPIVSTAYERVPVKNCRIEQKVYLPVSQRHGGHPRDKHFRNNGPHERYEQQSSKALPALFGGVIGGVIGNQFGSGDGRKAMTAIGAIVGASIATSSREEHKRDVRHPRRERVCTTRYEQEEYSIVTGYEVTYRYLGREFERVTREHPGDRVRLHVTVDPVDNQII